MKRRPLGRGRAAICVDAWHARQLPDAGAVRGIIVSQQTVRLWAEKFGRHFAGEIRRRSPARPGDKRYLDEVVTTIGGKKNWLWRAVDQDGFVLDVPVQIASIGLRYTNFHTTSLCSRTRAALITGRNHHSVGFGVISEASTGYPGYDSVITVYKGYTNDLPRRQLGIFALVLDLPQCINRIEDHLNSLR